MNSGPPVPQTGRLIGLGSIAGSIAVIMRHFAHRPSVIVGLSRVASGHMCFPDASQRGAQMTDHRYAHQADVLRLPSPKTARPSTSTKASRRIARPVSHCASAKPARASLCSSTASAVASRNTRSATRRAGRSIRRAPPRVIFGCRSIGARTRRPTRQSRARRRGAAVRDREGRLPGRPQGRT